MGNVISEEVAQLAQKSGLSVQAGDTGESSRGLMNRLAQIKGIRYILQGIVNRVYRWLNN
jgi:hypothetical protein